MFNPNDERFFYDLARCNEELLARHCSVEKNFLEGYIFKNNAFTLGLRSRETFSTFVFNYNLTAEDALRLHMVKFKDISIGGTLRGLGELTQTFGFRLLGEDLRRLSRLSSAATVRYGNNIGVSKTYEQFWGSITRGSKKIRQLLTPVKRLEIPHNIVKYASNTETIIGIDSAAKLNLFWNLHYLSNTLSTYFFKLINNILGYNHVVSHFVRGVERSCTFCKIARIQEEEDETPLHFFFTCTFSENIITHVYENLLGTATSRQEFFSIPVRDNIDTNSTLFLVNVILKKYLWDCKQRDSLPDSESAKFKIIHELKIMAKISKKVNMAINGSDLADDFKNSCR
jgi:hypothetical protein